MMIRRAHVFRSMTGADGHIQNAWRLKQINDFNWCSFKEIGIKSMGWHKEDVTPLLPQWNPFY